VAAEREHDGYRCRRRLCRQYRGITALRHNEGHMAAHEFCRQCGKPIIATLCPAVFNREVLAFDVAGFLQTLPECGNEVRIRSGRSAVKITDHRRRLLRACGERPHRNCRSADKRNEFPSSHGPPREAEDYILPYRRLRAGCATQQIAWLDVRFGSKADICSAKRHVRFTPNSDRESEFPQRAMSALPPKADMCSAADHVRFGPIADIVALIRTLRPLARLACWGW